MTLHIRHQFLMVLTLSIFSVPNVVALSVGQIDDFQDGTTMGWAASANPQGQTNPNPPANVSTGGPGGAGDSYLLITSNGGLASGSKPTAFNFLNQWAGDYTAAGIAGITMDVRNFGSTDLYLRLAVGNATDIAISQDAIHLPTATDWQSISFGVTVDDLDPLFGTIENALANAAFLRIFSNVDAAFPGPAQIATLSIDNISAVPIPGAIYFMLSALALLFRRQFIA